MRQPGEPTPGPRNAPERFGDWLDRIRRTATGFSVRTKILGIVLALTTVLGLAVTWQVRSAGASHPMRNPGGSHAGLARRVHNSKVDYQPCYIRTPHA